MIFSSVNIMIVLDIIIVGLVVLMLWASWSLGMFRQEHLPRSGRLLIVAGVVVTGLFYLADLLIMTALPPLIGRQRAMEIMTQLHLDVRWVVTLASLVLIAGGIIRSAFHRQRLARQMQQAEKHITAAQDRIIESEIRFRALVEQTPDSVYCFEYTPPIPVGLSIEEQVKRYSDAILVECNQVFASAIGKTSPAMALGLRMGDLDSAADVENQDRLVRKFVEQGYRLVDYELNYSDANGAEHALLISMSGIVRGEELTRIWGTSRNILEQTRTKTRLAGRLRFQQFAAEMSSQLLTASDDEAEEVLTQCLGQVGQYVRSECTGLVCFDENKRSISRRFFWSRFGEAPTVLLSPRSLPVIWQKIMRGESLALDSISDLNATAKQDFETLARAGVKSAAFVPLTVAGETLGTCIFSNVHAANEWSDEDMGDLRVLANLMANRVVQLEARQALDQALSELRMAKSRLESENIQLREEIGSTHDFSELVGESDSLMRCLQQVERVAGTMAPVLLQGETGTGKELIAKAIHRRSDRQNMPIVKVNCAALPANLIESELFGHEKGAFTGAVAQRLGRFDLANGGTLFLDEIADLPLEVQSKLLRALQSGEFERLGGSETMCVDVRIVAATNRDLQDAVEHGEFRADLYYRINAFPITLPALRDRRGDIPLLAEHFVQKHAEGLGKDVRAISATMLEELQRHEWPGNVRELEGVIQRALISATGPVLELPEPLRRDLVIPGSRGAAPVVQASDLRTVEKAHITSVLEQTDWVVGGDSGAATRLGLPASTLRSRMKKLGIGRPG